MSGQTLVSLPVPGQTLVSFPVSGQTLVSLPVSGQTLKFRPKSYVKKTGWWNLKLGTCCHLVLRLSSLWAVCPLPTRLRVISLLKQGSQSMSSVPYAAVVRSLCKWQPSVCEVCTGRSPVWQWLLTSSSYSFISLTRNTICQETVVICLHTQTGSLKSTIDLSITQRVFLMTCSWVYWCSVLSYEASSWLLCLLVQNNGTWP